MFVRLDGNKVRFEREELWLSQEELARMAGVGVSTLRNVEADIGRVRPCTARKLAGALCVEPKSLARAEVGLVLEFSPRSGLKTAS